MNYVLADIYIPSSSSSSSIPASTAESSTLGDGSYTESESDSQTDEDSSTEDEKADGSPITVSIHKHGSGFIPTCSQIFLENSEIFCKHFFL